MNRPSLLAAIPVVLKHLSAQRKHADQTSLFDAPTVEQLHLPELPDWDSDTKLWYERKALGCFLTGHPVVARRDAKKPGTFTHRCREERDIYASAGARIVVAGMVRSFSLHPGGRIGFFTIEDETGSLDLICFKDELQQFQHVFSDYPVNAIIAFELKPKVDFNRASLQITRAFRLGQFRNPERDKARRG